MHCQHVRSLLQAQRQTIHLRKQDHHPTEISGGVTLSLDLQKAFDLLPRDKLLAALEAAQAEPSLVWDHSQATRLGLHAVSARATGGVHRYQQRS